MNKFTFSIMLFSLILFGVLSANGQSLIHEYDPNSTPVGIDPVQGGNIIDGDGDWFTFASLPGATSTSGAANAYLNGKIYHFGGSPGPSADYLEWDEALDVWTPLGTIPGGPRYYTSAETVAGKIYLIGGSAGWPTPTGAVEIFDGVTWTTGAPMPVPVHDLATAVYQDRYIYTVGGMVGSWSDYRDAVQVYDTQTDTWAAATSFPMLAGCMAGGCVGNIIVVAGAYDGTQTNTIYEGEINLSDPTVITWTTSTGTLRDPAYRPGGGAAAGMVFFTGGQSPYSNQALGYDPLTDVVTMYPDKPTPLGNIGNFVPGNNMMYVMGGYDGGYNLACEGMEYAMGGGTSFFDDFDAYTAGVQLVAQNNVDWDTWSGGGGTGEDPFVSNAFSYSGSNTVVITQNNDLIRYHGELTTGKWYISFLLYIPTGGSGYFNSMSGFTPNPFQWAHEVFFDAGGGGRLMGVPGAPIAFTWAENTWQQAVVVVDLDLDQAEFWFGDSDPLTMVSSWQWTQGGTVNLQLDVTDFFGAAATEEMYVDNYYFDAVPPVIIPVELTSFTALVNDNDVTLNWVTASEINNQGFEIERNSGNGFQNIGYVAGFGTSTETHSYSFVDNALNEGTYSYRLKQIDLDGSFEYSDVVEVDVTVPDVFALEQNYPNPFNPSTRINFSLAVDSKVNLKVFDVLGQEVVTLINSDLVAGSHNVDFSAANINSGVYFYRIDVTGIDGTNFTNVKKMILTK